MLTLVANLPLRYPDWALVATPSLNVSWAIVLFFLILGLLVTLSPSRRATEIKRRRDE
jgi:ABC-type lipoprotein release transport system permease subunit